MCDKQQQDYKKSFINRAVPHLKQCTMNDCGVTCFKMILKYLNSDLGDLESLLNKLEIKDISLWTIDIAHLCALKGIRHQMYTITWGVDGAFQTEEYYNMEYERFLKDQSRINLLFETHRNLGINVELKEISLEYIRDELSRNNLCILLIDATKLNGTNLDENEGDSALQILEQQCDEKRGIAASCCLNLKQTMTSSYGQYMGHFIVLVGYDDDKEIIFYRNPSRSENLSYTTFASIETARKSYGTDQDILFIYSDS